MTIECSHNATGNRVYGFHYNPFEIAIHAQSPEHRARLAAKLGGLFAAAHVVGHVIERETQMPEESVGRMGVNLVRGDGQHGLLYPGDLDDYLRPRPLIDVDIAFVESSSSNDMPKIVWIEDGSAPRVDNVIAYVGAREPCPVLPPSAAYFTEDQSLPLHDHVRQHFENLVANMPLYGLVLTGGMSTRMGADKGALEYHGQSQAAYCYGLLESFCDEVYLSLREEQSEEEAYRDYRQIHDTFLGFGPLGGILSALKAHPRAAWLVLACDLPAVTSQAIDYLVSGRNPFKLATAYVSANDGFPEPLCAIYEPKSIFRLMGFLALGYHCPRKVLINSDTWLLDLPEPRALDNANTPEERAAAVVALSRGAPVT